jgi:hypothetical protein
MKHWNDLSGGALRTMKDLGNFSPTFHHADKQIKGYVGTDESCLYERTYLTAKDLLEMAAGFIEVADWLDERATNEDVLAPLDLGK